MTVKPRIFVGDSQPSGTTTDNSSKWMTHAEESCEGELQQVVVCLGRPVLPSDLVVEILEQASGLGAPVVAVDSDNTVPVVPVVVLARAVDGASEPVAGVRHLLQSAVAAAAVVDDFLPAAHVGLGCWTGMLDAFDGDADVWY